MLNSNLGERDRQTDTETDTGIYRETFLHTIQCSTVPWEKETDRQTQAYTERQKEKAGWRLTDRQRKRDRKRWRWGGGGGGRKRKRH